MSEEYPIQGGKRALWKLEARAVNNRWPVSAERKEKVIQTLEDALDDEDSTVKDRIAAAKAMMEAEKQNQKDELEFAEVESSRNRFLEVAARLGITGSAGAISSDGSTADPPAAGQEPESDSPDS